MSDDTLLRDLSVCVKDIQDTQTLIVGQINKIGDGCHEGTCWMSCNDETDTLINSSMQRITTQENNDQETTQEVSRLTRRLEALHESIKNIEIYRGVRSDKSITVDESGDESTSNKTLKLQTNATKINKNVHINEHNLCNEETNKKSDLSNENEEVEVYDNDILQDNDVPEDFSETVEITTDDLYPCYDKSDNKKVYQDIINPQSELIDTDIKSENVIQHEEKTCLDNFDVWNARADDEMNAAQESGLRYLRGLHTVVCIDTSSSILGEIGVTHVRAFVNDYLNGLKEIDAAFNDRDENVALVTFGKETHVTQRLTNDYNKVLKVFEKIEFGGPTPMYGGLAMAIAAAQSTLCHSANVNGMTINTKIILLTDGWPTNSCMVKGPDDSNDPINDDTQHEVLSKIAEIAARPYLDLFVVPVGKANMQFLELVVNIADGKMQHYDEGTHFSRRSILCALAGPRGPLSLPYSETSGLVHMLPLRLTEKDKELVKELREEGKRSDGFSFKLKENGDNFHDSNDSDLPAVGLRIAGVPGWTPNHQNAGIIIGHSETTGGVRVEINMLRDEEKSSDSVGMMLNGDDDHYHDSNDSDLPAVGLRVVSGPDWTHKNQDAGGPGTIVGHSETTGSVWIEWDRNAEINVYRYNEQNGYAVLLTDQPREIYNGSTKQIAVGCVVKPGKDFNFIKETHVNRKDKGVVIKMLKPSEDSVLVKWNNFKRVRGEYSFGKNDCYEVKLCQSSKSEHDMFLTDPIPKDKPKTIKNKN